MKSSTLLINGFFNSHTVLPRLMRMRTIKLTSFFDKNTTLFLAISLDFGRFLAGKPLYEMAVTLINYDYLL